MLMGRNLRILLLLLLPLAFLFWLPAIFFGTFLGSTVYNNVIIAHIIFDERKPLLISGVWECYKDNHDFVSSFWEFCSAHVFWCVHDMSYIPRGWNGEVYEIPLIKVLIGFILAIYGTIVGLLIATVIVVIKFLPGVLIRANVEYLKRHPTVTGSHFGLVDVY